MSQTTYESRLPSVLPAPGQEVLLVQTRSGVPVGYGRDHKMEQVVDLFPCRDAALEFLQARARMRAVIHLTRGDLLVEVIRLTRVGAAVDEYRIFNA